MTDCRELKRPLSPVPRMILTALNWCSNRTLIRQLFSRSIRVSRLGISARTATPRVSWYERSS